jgi:hypothetical protein
MRLFLRTFCWTYAYLLLPLILRAVSFQVGSSSDVTFHPHTERGLGLDYFLPNTQASPPPDDVAHPSSIIATRANCPTLNSSAPIQLVSALSNEVVDCGGNREYVYNLTGSCSDDVYSMIVLTLEDNTPPYASVDVFVRSPSPMNFTTYASPSPSRRYYIMQMLSTCPGT